MVVDAVVRLYKSMRLCRPMGENWLELSFVQNSRFSKVGKCFSLLCIWHSHSDECRPGNQSTGPV